ncbi:hypothetical protein MPTK2_8g02480 [Marchantia polymorpha subsp. ruderalis]
MENVCIRSQRNASVLVTTLWLIGLLHADGGPAAAAAAAPARADLQEQQEFYSRLEEHTFNLRGHSAADVNRHVVKSPTDALLDSEIEFHNFARSRRKEEQERRFSSLSSESTEFRDTVGNYGYGSERGPVRQLLTTHRHSTLHHHESGFAWKQELSSQSSGSASKDALALLEFKRGVIEDPQGVLSTWDAATAHVCQGWTGVVCDPVSGGVIEINLPNFNLKGTLSPKLGDLASLHELVLSNNSFTGVIPASLGDASALHTIRLDSNNLQGAIPDSLGQLTGLLTLDLHSNQLDGYIPKSLGGCTSLISLVLDSNQLIGTIPDSLKGCLGLQVLRVDDNQLTGGMPNFLDSLPELTVLHVSGNLLSGSIPSFSPQCSNLLSLSAAYNQLTGEIPGSIGNCTKLQTLLLDDNHLTGSIPQEIEFLGDLSSLSLRGNNLTGTIPTSLGNLMNLTVVQIDDNHLTGVVPSSFGKLPLLQTLSLAHNELTGEVPSTLWNAQNLESLDLQGNSLSGLLSISTGLQVSRLREIVLSDNQLSGPIPPDVGRLQNLEVLGLGANQLSGMIPASLGNCSKMKVIDLSANLLTGTIPSELGFLTQLVSLQLSDNGISGSIPNTLSNCSQLMDLQLSTNHLSGLIPAGFSSMQRLQMLSLRDNKFGMTFPDFLEGIGNLTRIDLSGNHLSGPIPVSIGNFTNLQSLNLANNRLTGPIPLELFSLVTLEELVLTNNILDGEIPPEIGQLVRLSSLLISNNNFTGPFPSSLGNCTNLQELNMANNRFSGPLPGATFSQLTRLSVKLNLASNHFSGVLPKELGYLVSVQKMNFSFNSFVFRVPASLANCTALEWLDMSHNHLCGELPPQLALMTNLVYFNVSANNLEGPIPIGGIFSNNLTADSFWGNPRLCGYQIDRNCSIAGQDSKCQGFHCSWFAVTSGVIGIILVGIGVTIWYCLFTKVIEYHRKTLGPEMPHVQQLKVTVHDLTKATDAFSLDNIIGVGRRSIVFKGVLPSGALIAVKKLEKEKNGTNLWDKKDQYREIDFLGKLRHPNLMKTLSVCWNLDTKALVFDFMENGTLSDHLHAPPVDSDSDTESILTWDIRRNIALGIAKGLVFLHHDCAEKRGGEPVIHGDLKPSNIFLDDDFQPKIADFGLARLIMPDDITEGDEEALEMALTICDRDYIAPECICPQARFSMKGDVYSFGIILLELVTGMHPSEDASCFGEEANLVEWIREANTPENVIDQRLRGEFQEVAKKHQMLLTLQTGMLCTQEAYQKRPDMKEVLEILNRTKERTFNDGEDSPV